MAKEKSQPIKQISYLNDFRCAADKCVDTCCANWVINTTNANKEFYDNHNLEIAKDVETHSDGAYKMKEKPNGECVQLKDGLCSLQQRFGETHLPDVCYTFPRSYKQIENHVYMTSNLACPESLRVALYNNKEDDFSTWSDVTQSRSKDDLYDSRTGAFATFRENKVIDLANVIAKMFDNEDFTADESLARLLFLSHQMDGKARFDWFNVKKEIDLITKDSLYAISEENIENVDMRGELFNILDAMFNLVNRDRPRYNVVMDMMRQYLGDNNSNEEDLINKFEEIYVAWQENGKEFDQILKNLIKAQLSYILFPVNNYFTNQYHSIIVIVLEYFVVKLALMSESYKKGGKLSEQEVIDVIQPTTKRFFVRGRQELYDFCREKGWDDLNKVISIILNFS